MTANVVRILTPAAYEAIAEASRDVRAAAIRLSRYAHSPAPTLERELANATAHYYSVVEACMGRDPAIVDDGTGEAAE